MISVCENGSYGEPKREIDVLRGGSLISQEYIHHLSKPHKSPINFFMIFSDANRLLIPGEPGPPDGHSAAPKSPVKIQALRGSLSKSDRG